MGTPIGQRVGQYEILAPLGEGGMATVYRARQITIGREVALKVIRPEFNLSGDFLARFEQEARTTATLSHPHILKVFDYGQQDTLVYLITELMTGGSLADLLWDETPSMDKIEHMLAQVASALDYAHEQGVIHRDLKPSNLLLDANENVYLTDFGLAKIQHSTSKLTASGSVVGTPAYMSPEQWRGEQLTGSSDNYSLAVVLYEMLSGNTPFQRDSTHGMMYAHLNEPPPLLETTVTISYPAINHVLQRALAKDPTARYPSATALYEAFRSARLGVPELVLTTTEDPQGKASILSSQTQSRTLNSSSPYLVSVPKWVPILGAVLMMFLVGVLAIIALSNRSGTAATASATATTATTSDAPTTPPNQITVSTVKPVATDEYMVLVAKLETLDAQSPDPSRFIVDNLTQNLDIGIPFSKFRVRQYPAVINTPDQALEAAKANNATAVVWGSIGNNLTDLHIQVGVTSAFKFNKFSEDMLRRTIDVQVRMTDPRTQSIAPQILNLFITLQNADGNGYEVMRTNAVLAELKVTPAEVQGVGVAAMANRVYPKFLADADGFVADITQIVELDPGNPLMYAIRALAYFRQGRFEESMRDAQTARRIGPPGWASPIFIIVNHWLQDSKNYANIIDLLTPLVEERPTDWFMIWLRSTVYYFMGQYQTARDELSRAIALNPPSNFPYLLALLCDFRLGAVADGQQIARIVVKNFPDPTYGERVARVMFGTSNSPIAFFGVMYAAGTNIILGQYDAALRSTEAGLALSPNRPELYLFRGGVYCATDKLAEAEIAFGKGIELDPTFTVLYLLRADVRREQKKPEALQDLLTVRQANIPELTKLLDDPKSIARLNCKSMMSGSFIGN